MEKQREIATLKVVMVNCYTKTVVLFVIHVEILSVLNIKENQIKTDSIRFKRELVIRKINEKNTITEEYVKFFNKRLKEKMCFVRRFKKYYYPKIFKYVGEQFIKIVDFLY